jgi:hypothetical protein
VKLTLQDVTVGGDSFARVQKDNGNLVPQPEWPASDINPAPNMFRVTNSPQFTCHFNVQPSGFTNQVSIKGTGAFHWNAVSFAPSNNVITTTAMTATNTFTNKVQMITYDQAFCYVINGTNSASAGTSSHAAYLTLGTPTSERHTIVDLACNGTGDPGDTFTEEARKYVMFLGLWGKFSGMDMAPAAGEPSGTLTYKTVGVMPFIGCDANYLVQNHWGQCTAWAQLLGRACAVNSLQSPPIVNLQFNQNLFPHPGAPSDPPNNWRNRGFCLSDVTGHQGNGELTPYFLFHQVCRVGNDIYDPSYGRSVTGQGSWADTKCAYERMYLTMLYFERWITEPSPRFEGSAYQEVNNWPDLWLWLAWSE